MPRSAFTSEDLPRLVSPTTTATGLSGCQRVTSSTSAAARASTVRSDALPAFAALAHSLWICWAGFGFAGAVFLAGAGLAGDGVAVSVMPAPARGRR